MRAQQISDTSTHFHFSLWMNECDYIICGIVLLKIWSFVKAYQLLTLEQMDQKPNPANQINFLSSEAMFEIFGHVSAGQPHAEYWSIFQNVSWNGWYKGAKVWVSPFWPITLGKYECFNFAICSSIFSLGEIEDLAHKKNYNQILNGNQEPL